MRWNSPHPPALLLVAALSLGCSTASPGQENTSPTKILLEKAHTLEMKDRMDMAAQTWQQVILADPNNTEALGGLARAAKVAGNQALANTYLQRLRAINPNDAGIERAERAMSQTARTAQLQQAAKLAGQGNYTAAMAIYRRVFGAQPPSGDWALAYYETEAATGSGGHGHAIAALRSLAELYPRDTRYSVTLGRILTYDPKTRAEGRRLLEKFPRDPQASEALRQSLHWDAQNPATAGEIRNYLLSHTDAQLQESLRAEEAAAARSRSGASPQEIQQQRALSAEEKAAYASLNAKRFAEADTRFQALLAKDSHNPRALAGLGYVRMNQGNLTGAISFLEQAKADGAKDPGLEKSLDSARFYYILSEAGVALNEDDLTNAEQKYRHALTMRPDSPEALQGLGGTLLKAGQAQAADQVFQQYVRVRPKEISAWRGLFLSEFQGGNTPAALTTERRLPSAVRTQLMRDPEFLRVLASAYSSAGRDADAQKVLQTALALPFPQHGRGLKADTQLQYASLLLQASRFEQATGLYRQVLADDPNNVAAWKGLVNAQHAMHSDPMALQTLESMPPVVYDQALRDAGFLASAAAIYQANSKYDLSQSLLERSISALNTSGQSVPMALQLQLAGLYLQRNDAAHAYPIYQRVLSQNPDRVDAWKGLLSSLHTAGRDGEALSQILQIPEPVRKQLENDVEYLQNVGQIYNSLGQPREAKFFLARVQQHYAAQHAMPPAEVDIQNAWLLYNGSDDTGLYRQLLYLGGRHDLSDEQRRTVQTIWANWAVRRSNQISAANRPRRALDILNAAAKAFPDNPAVIKALANGYVQAGLPKEAIAIFKAQDMTAAPASDYKSAVGAALSANDLKMAEVWLRYGLDRYPQDAEILNLAARFEQARGDSNRAAAYYRASLAAMPPTDPGAELASVLNQPAPLNPRALPSAQQPQDLASMLAPDADSGPNRAAAPPPQPYLPSYTNAYGTAPVQLGNAPEETSSPDGNVVPSYMSNSDRSHGGSSRLGDYTPPRSSYGDPGAPSGFLPQSYAPPEIAPVPGMAAASSTPRILPGSETEYSSDGYLAFQREQIRRAATQAASTYPDPDGLGNITYNGPEGAQTGSFNGEVYGPYVPYVPPSQTGRSMVSYNPSRIDVPKSSTIITDFPLGAGSSVPFTNAENHISGGQIHHTQTEAADAAEIRRGQSDPFRRMPSNSSMPLVELAENGGRNAQYTGTLPATEPTGAFQNGNLQTGSGSVAPTGRGRQQYPQPIRRPGSPSTARRTRPRAARAVSGFGVNQPPIFYPGVPTSLNSQPYPDLPPYNYGAGQTPPTDPQLMARNLPPLRNGSLPSAVDSEAGPPLTARQQTELDLAQLEGSYSAWIGGGAWLRTRSGDPGINRLFDYEVPFEASVVAGKTARFTIIPKGVFLNSGTIDGSRYTTASTVLGTFPANSAITPAPQYASGIGGEIQMVTQNLGVAVGYTPYEFPVHNITARFRYRPGGGLITFYGERDSVRDTQLAYAGMRDPGSVTLTSSGNIWGGVVSTGGGIRIDHGNERSGFYASADGSVITGQHVLDNNRIEGTLGAYFRVHQFPGYGTLNIGATMFAMHYAHNERPLTYGNGGYFSPDAYFLGSIPITFTGHYKDQWHYVIQGGIGIQTFQEDTAEYYPLDPSLQTGAYSGCSIPEVASHTCTTAELPVNTSTGANFNINAEATYRIADHWYAGAALTANNTNNYNLVQPTVFLRYLFRPQYPTDDYPTGLFPVGDGFRPLRVP